MDYLGLMKVCACIVIALHCALFGRPKDVQGCSAAPEEFSPTAFLALCLFRGSQRACVVFADNVVATVSPNTTPRALRVQRMTFMSRQIDRLEDMEVCRGFG